MVDTVSQFNQVFLTYKDVAEANPSWSDRMVEDYLATKRDIEESTVIADKAVNSASSSALVPALIKKVDMISFDVNQVDGNFTTFRNQILICRNTTDITVTLNPYPAIDEEVHIKRRDASILVVGPIDGFTNRTINVKNYSMHLVFDGTDWSEI